MPHTIYILDLGIPAEYRTRIIKAIRDIRREALVEILWIDHHQSIYLDEMEKYVNLFIDPEVPHAAHLVRDIINSDPEVNQLLDLLQNANTPFVDYWRPVLKEMVRTIHNTRLRDAILRALATFNKTAFTDELYQRHQLRTARPSGTIERIYRTKQGHAFALFPFQGDSELYPTVHAILKELKLDFLLVAFENGSYSAYKNPQSPVDLTPLVSLVGGKGHAHAFHFDPQRRLDDEFYRGLSSSELILSVQEVL